MITITYLIIICLFIEIYYIKNQRTYIFQNTLDKIHSVIPLKIIFTEIIYVFSILILLIDYWPFALPILTLMIFRNLLFTEYYKKYNIINQVDFIIRIVLFFAIFRREFYDSGLFS